ncbi:hypothetical protein MGI18_20695 [Bacillus sp. OVS6]|nr:hypothetical protein MGI18_20695 [Bacillus sp. OVS6]
MDLVEFILSNPLVIAGLIFVLSSLFGKKRRENNSEGKRKTQQLPHLSLYRQLNRPKLSRKLKNE